MGLAYSRRSQERHVGVPLDELQRREVPDLAGFETGLEGEVELLKGLVVRQPGQPQGVAEPAALADPEFLTQEQVQEVEVAHLVGLSTGDELADALQPKAHNQLLDGLAKASAKRFKCERTMLVKLCKLAVHEHIFRFCQGCGGAKQQQGENKIITCQTCAGTGIHRHTDEGRALALELTQDAYQKGWNNRLQKVQEILSAKVQNTTKLAASKYYD